MKKYDYNLIAIGAGAGGLVTSYICAAVKAKVALIEKHKMGGDCLNTGCVPSKSLIRTTKVLQTLKKGDLFGIENIDYKVNFEKVMDQVQHIIQKIEPHDSIERYTKLGVDCITGTAEILSPHEVKVGHQTLTTKNIVIATGARPKIPPIPGLEEIDFVHSDNIWELRTLPKRMLFLGAGPIGCELAQCFSRLGSKVTILNTHATVLAREDEDVVQFVQDSFQKDGLLFKGNVVVKRFEKNNHISKVIYEQNGKINELEFDTAVIAIGRTPNTKGFGLEKIGIDFNPNGTIKVDAYLRTKIKNMYACGDVAGPYQFTHTAAHQAWYCAVNALFHPFKKFKVDYSVIPWVTYTDPEIAHVGLNEKTAKEKNISYEVTRYGIDDLDRAITDREDHGMVKVLTVPKKDTILGATIVGYHAGELLGEFILAMKYNIGLNKILGTIHPYPTLIEANKYVAGEWKKAHAPQGILNFLQKFHAWRRK